jgi:hypothetical protein
MARLHIPPLVAKPPVWSLNKEHKTLVAEHSSLGNPRLNHYIYDDACDVGIALYSPKTGHTITWYESQPVFRDGELCVWIFKPLPEDVRKHPQLEGWEVHILND